MVTIKELSDSIGISKVGITKWIERNGYKDRLQKIGNKYFIPVEVEQVVRANFDRRETKPKKVANDTRETENTVTSEIIALLREQLETKDREIERLHTQIENLQKIIQALIYSQYWNNYPRNRMVPGIFCVYL